MVTASSVGLAGKGVVTVLRLPLKAQVPPGEKLFADARIQNPLSPGYGDQECDSNALKVRHCTPKLREETKPPSMEGQSTD